MHILLRRLLLTSLLFFVLSSATALAQIDKFGYHLVYSSESPEAASAAMDLTDEELECCTGDFLSTENFERNWLYCPRQTSKWNMRMAENDEDRAKVHLCEDGKLRLLALSLDGTKTNCITSGIKMKQGYKYGIFEIKAKCNPHKSNFPAVWMMPSNPYGGWPNCGEIDIMEQVGTSSTVYSTVHLGARYDQKVGKNYSWSGSKWVDTGYHIYSLLWTKSSLTFYCDGKQVFKYQKDGSLDLQKHPEYEHAQFPYNEAYYIILDQALGSNSGWGNEDPDPSFTYEMTVDYVRIFQAPAEEEKLEYYFIQNVEEPTYYMTASEEGLVGTTDIDFQNPDPDALFCFPSMDAGTKKYIRTQSQKWVMSQSVNNKAIPLGEEGVPYYILRDEEKGVAFDYAKDTYPATFVDGSRALILNEKKDYIVSTSGTSKASAWWKLITVEDAQAASIEEDGGLWTKDDQRRESAVRKVVRDNRLVILHNGREYTVTGSRLK
ncbi:MAG: glycoside hydrolase family 16 protein [Prevotella sp.]|nr:glycoside hydrolase family 16 protein [Prevotella sp.]MBQ6682299.1 glycoside hydrolase family 16 protein [Prevotella sp.]